MDIKDMQIFISLVDCGTFSAAARMLDMQTSTLSRRIAGLEKQLGVALIDRGPRHFRVTDAGRRLYDHCSLIVREADMAVRSVQLEFAGQAAHARDGEALSRMEPAPRASASGRIRRHDIVQSHILRALRSKSCKVGDKLPAERELASTLGVSRQAVREAIRSLEMSGVLRLERGARGGAFVRDMGAGGITYAIRNLLILGDLPLNDVLELRAVVFGLAARFAAQRGTRHDFEQMKQNIRHLSLYNRKYPQSASIELSTGFYRLAGRASGNSLLCAFVDSLSDIMEEMLAHMQNWPMMAEGCQVRQEALDVIRAGDGEKAEHIVRSHCMETNRVLLEFGRGTYAI